MPATGFTFTRLVTSDLDAAEMFFRDIFGFETTGGVEHGEGAELMHERFMALPDAPDPKLMLVRYPNRPAPATGEAMIGLTVPSVDDTLASATAAGATIVVPPTDVPGHDLRPAFLRSPQGHIVEILQALA